MLLCFICRPNFEMYVMCVELYIIAILPTLPKECIVKFFYLEILPTLPIGCLVNLHYCVILHCMDIHTGQFSHILIIKYFKIKLVVMVTYKLIHKHTDKINVVYLTRTQSARHNILFTYWGSVGRFPDVKRHLAIWQFCIFSYFH